MGEGDDGQGAELVRRGLRLPGHGTTPSGLKTVTWRDMAANRQELVLFGINRFAVNANL
jgi:hypothetical protein